MTNHIVLVSPLENLLFRLLCIIIYFLIYFWSFPGPLCISLLPQSYPSLPHFHLYCRQQQSILGPTKKILLWKKKTRHSGIYAERHHCIKRAPHFLCILNFYHHCLNIPLICNIQSHHICKLFDRHIYSFIGYVDRTSQ